MLTNGTKYWIPVVGYAIFIFFLSSLPGSLVSSKLVIPDYILHFIEYLPFGFLVFRAVKKTNPQFSLTKVMLLSCLGVALYSLSDELHQFFVPGRDASWIDLVWDNLGAVIGMRFAV